MNNCKKIIKNLVSSDIISKAKEFIDIQACLEKKNRQNIDIENKRTIKGFIKTNEIFLKKNFYYISQKYIIYLLISYYCNDYLNEFQKHLNNIVEGLIDKEEEDSEINKCIADCFASKLKKFGEKMKVNFGYEKYEKNKDNILEASLNDNFNNEKLSIEIENENNNSFEIYDEEEELVFDNKEENEKIISFYLSKLLKDNWKYLNKDLSFNLNNLMKQFKYKDTSDNYYTKNNYFINDIFNSLKNYEKYDLELFLNNNIQYFLQSIYDNFKRIKDKYELTNNKQNLIKKIFEKSGLDKIQFSKIEKEFEELGKDIKYKKIDYLTIIITGRTGVGKSALINALLKEYLAKEGMKDIVTTKPYKYENKKNKFLKLIDKGNRN